MKKIRGYKAGISDRYKWYHSHILRKEHKDYDEELFVTPNWWISKSTGEPVTLLLDSSMHGIVVKTGKIKNRKEYLDKVEHALELYEEHPEMRDDVDRLNAKEPKKEDINTPIYFRRKLKTKW